MARRTVSATTAARDFSRLLDEIDRTGDSVEISRHGRLVAVLVPVGIRPRRPGDDEPDSEPDAPTGAGKRRFPEIEEILRPVPGRDPLLRELLGRIEDLGTVLSKPAGRYRRDYVNVHAPGIRGRILGVNTASGRAEFQKDSWDALGRPGSRFEHLPSGNKAAHPLETESDVDAIVEATRSEIDRKS